MDRLQRMLGAGGMGGGGAGVGDAPQQDTSEQIYISSLALLKMLKHGRAGVPLEVRRVGGRRADARAARRRRRRWLAGSVGAHPPLLCRLLFTPCR